MCIFAPCGHACLPLRLRLRPLPAAPSRSSTPLSPQPLHSHCRPSPPAGAPQLLHVSDRARRAAVCDARGGDPGGAGRRHHAYHQVRWAGGGGREGGRGGSNVSMPTSSAVCPPPPGKQTHNHANTHPHAGVAHGAFDTELDALAGVRELLSFLPSSNREPPPRVRAGAARAEGASGRPCSGGGSSLQTLRRWPALGRVRPCPHAAQPPAT